MKKVNKIISFVLMGIVLQSCTTKSSKNDEKSVKVDVCYPSLVSENGFYLSGQIVAKQSATISTRLMGYVNKVYVQIGDKVSAGQLLISINHNDVIAKQGQVEAMIKAAKASLNNAKKDYERYKVLHAQNSVSDKELENVELQYTAARSNLRVTEENMKEVDVNMAYGSIKAPFSGVVTQRFIDEGSMANPGAPLLIIEHSGDLEVQASVPENYVSSIKIGDQANIKVDATGQKFIAKVIELSPSAVATGGQYMMKLSIGKGASSRLQTGMYATLFFDKNVDTSASDEIIINGSSLVYKDQLTGVYTVDKDNKAILRWVRLGKKTNIGFEVLSGLSSTDKIVLKAYGKLYNGVSVNPSK